MELKHNHFEFRVKPNLQSPEIDSKVDKGETILNISENYSSEFFDHETRQHCDKEKRKRHDIGEFDLHGYHLMYASYYNCYEAYIKLQSSYAKIWSTYYAVNAPKLGRKHALANTPQSYMEAWSKFFNQNLQNGDTDPQKSSMNANNQPQMDVPTSQQPEYDFFQKNTLQSSTITLPNSNEPKCENVDNIAPNQENNVKVGENKNWFGFLKRFKPKPVNQMVLPDDNKPTIVWSQQRNCWINTENSTFSEELKPPFVNEFNSSSNKNPFRRSKKIAYKNIFDE